MSDQLEDVIMEELSFLVSAIGNVRGDLIERDDGFVYVGSFLQNPGTGIIDGHHRNESANKVEVAVRLSRRVHRGIERIFRRYSETRVEVRVDGVIVMFGSIAAEKAAEIAKLVKEQVSIAASKRTDEAVAFMAELKKGSPA